MPVPKSTLPARLLSALARGPVTTPELARACAWGRSNALRQVGTVLRRLELDGLVARVHRKEERRTQWVTVAVWRLVSVPVSKAPVLLAEPPTSYVKPERNRLELTPYVKRKNKPKKLARPTAPRPEYVPHREPTLEELEILIESRRSSMPNDHPDCGKRAYRSGIRIVKDPNGMRRR